jgi:hypothetical protein
MRVEASVLPAKQAETAGPGVWAPVEPNVRASHARRSTRMQERAAESGKRSGGPFECGAAERSEPASGEGPFPFESLIVLSV